MTVRPARLPRALLALGVAAAVPLAGCAGKDASASSPSSSPSASASTGAPADEQQRIEVTVSGGQVSGDTGRVSVPAGTRVDLVVTSDTADEVHVHGYDLTFPLAPGEPGGVNFATSLPGVFEVELHESGTLLLTLQVE